MSEAEIQAELMKRHSGPSMGFVKLRLGVLRTPDMVAEIAMKWTKVLRTGAIGARFMGVDRSTIMFTMERGQDTAKDPREKAKSETRDWLNNVVNYSSYWCGTGSKLTVGK